VLLEDEKTEDGTGSAWAKNQPAAADELVRAGHRAGNGFDRSYERKNDSMARYGEKNESAGVDTRTRKPKASRNILGHTTRDQTTREVADPERTNEGLVTRLHSGEDPARKSRPDNEALERWIQT
jgi:hypothetical protein